MYPQLLQKSCLARETAGGLLKTSSSCLDSSRLLMGLIKQFISRAALCQGLCFRGKKPPPELCSHSNGTDTFHPVSSTVH